jgi:hypothetical protein
MIDPVRLLDLASIYRDACALVGERWEHLLKTAPMSPERMAAVSTYNAAKRTAGIARDALMDYARGDAAEVGR